MSHFHVTSQIFDNARRFEVRHTRLPPFGPVDELVDEIHSWFRDLKHEDEDWVQVIRTRLWRIKTTALCALLPFSDAELGLQTKLNVLSREAGRLPPLRPRLSTLSERLHRLIEHPENPKRTATHALLRRAEPEDGALGLVTMLARGALPGWSGRLREEVRGIAPHCRFISSGRQLRSAAYDQIILAAGSRWCPLLHDLYHCARSATLEVVTYSSESAEVPPRRGLPRGSRSPRTIETTPDINARVDEADQQVEESGQDAFWHVVRRAAVDDGDPRPAGGRLFLVSARLLLLANNTQVFLQEDSKVIEISHLVEHATAPSGKKPFPRRSVSEVTEGDLIVLRTSGSGDYLIDVADALMRQGGKEDLRANALDWKPLLRQALEEHGAEEIARRLSDRGYGVSSASYIWMWTTNLVIRPRSEAVFYELMAILDDFGYQSDRRHLLEMIDSRWNAMKEIIHYHRMAGQRIRQSLLRRLREILKQGADFEDEYRLTLPGLDAGELAVFRVSAVDRETIEVPYHQVGLLRSLDL